MNLLENFSQVGAASRGEKATLKVLIKKLLQTWRPRENWLTPYRYELVPERLYQEELANYMVHFLQEGVALRNQGKVATAFPTLQEALTTNSQNWFEKWQAQFPLGDSDKQSFYYIFWELLDQWEIYHTISRIRINASSCFFKAFIDCYR